MVPSFDLSPNPEEVCKLKKALYRLKQALQAGFAKFSYVFISLGFHPNHHDHVFFLKYTTIGFILLSV